MTLQLDKQQELDSGAEESLQTSKLTQNVCQEGGLPLPRLKSNTKLPSPNTPWPWMGEKASRSASVGLWRSVGVVIKGMS